MHKIDTEWKLYALAFPYRIWVKQRHVIFAAIIKQNIVREYQYRVSYVNNVRAGVQVKFLVSDTRLRVIARLTDQCSVLYIFNECPLGNAHTSCEYSYFASRKGKKYEISTRYHLSHSSIKLYEKNGENRKRCFEEVLLDLTCPLGSKNLAMPLQMSVCHKETESIYQQNFSISYVLLPKL